MKKLFLSVGLLLTTIVFAQKKWAVEVKMGANLISRASGVPGTVAIPDEQRIIQDLDITLDPTMSVSVKNKSGLIAGVLGTYFISDKIGIKSGFIYDRRGFKLDVDVGLFNPTIGEGTLKQKVKAKINMLTIPFYGQYETGGKVKGFFYAGPYISIPLSTKATGEDASLIFQTGETLSLKNSEQDSDNPDTEFGVGLGAGLIVPISDALDFITDVGYKVGINESLGKNQGRLYDFALNVGLRHRF